MDGKVKYLSVLVLALLVSVATSYVTTSVYLAIRPAESPNVGTVDVNNLPPQVMQQISDDIVLKLTKTNVSLPFEVSFFAADDSLVEVHSRVALENLTIVYEYTWLSDGTTVVESVDYGTFIPAWGAGAVIEEGASPEGLYKIPDRILQQCATAITNSNGCLVFEGTPQLEVLGVFGYS
jgi:hypothetical protein